MGFNERMFRFGLGLSGRLAITMSTPPGKLAKIPSCVMEIVFVGSEEYHCCRAIAGSWLGYSCCWWANRCVAADKASGLMYIHALVPMWWPFLRRASRPAAMLP